MYIYLYDCIYKTRTPLTKAHRKRHRLVYRMDNTYSDITNKAIQTVSSATCNTIEDVDEFINVWGFDATAPVFENIKVKLLAKVCTILFAYKYLY